VPWFLPVEEVVRGSDDVPMTAPEELLDALDPEQREVATALDGPLRVLAGAGTGKTRAITHRFAYGVATGAMVPNEVLAVTFTTRAAGELRQRLARLGAPGVQARTFHSAALRQARYFWPQVYGGDLPELVSSKLSLLAEATSRYRLKASQADLKDLAGEVEWAKVTNVRPDDYPRVADARGRALDGFDHATTAKVYATYEEVKQSRNRMDMEDALLYAAAVIDADERVASAVRRQYQSFVVDEFQDVSPLQFRLLRLWLGDRDDVCVVGDPAQTIYTFAGASADHLLEFPKQFPGTTSVTLHRNYRSTPQVIATANTVMAGQLGRSAVQLKATRPDGAKVEASGQPDEVAEAEAVAVRIAKLVADGTNPADIAVLFRINAQSDNVEEALANHGVPFVVRGAERFFQRPEVRQAVTLLRGAARVESEPSCSVRDDVVAALSTMGWTPDPPAGRGNARDRWESLQALVSDAEAFVAANPERTLADLVADLQRRAELQEAPIAEGVTLATMHTAKGLEWPVVFVVGLHEGTMPFVYAGTPAAVDEERRLMYVAVTRARDSLHLSWSHARNPGGRATRQPSRFLDGVVAGAGPRPAGERPGRARSRRNATLTHCRVCSRPLTDSRERKLGRCADCPSAYDEVLFDSLRSWRREQAAVEKVPAYCVFTDATMTALAEIQPGDTDALLKVPGIGQAKADKYGAEILALIGADPAARPTVQDGLDGL
jgi:DNA helicase-2/ATP-dependent DNA helicase PcrA